MVHGANRPVDKGLFRVRLRTLGSGTVLLVDDEEAVRQWHVLEWAGAQQAALACPPVNGRQDAKSQQKQA